MHNAQAHLWCTHKHIWSSLHDKYICVCHVFFSCISFDFKSKQTLTVNKYGFYFYLCLLLLFSIRLKTKNSFPWLDFLCIWKIFTLSHIKFHSIHHFGFVWQCIWNGMIPYSETMWHCLYILCTELPLWQILFGLQFTNIRNFNKCLPKKRTQKIYYCLYMYYYFLVFARNVHCSFDFKYLFYWLEQHV